MGWGRRVSDLMMHMGGVTCMQSLVFVWQVYFLLGHSFGTWRSARWLLLSIGGCLFFQAYTARA